MATKCLQQSLGSAGDIKFLTLSLFWPFYPKKEKVLNLLQHIFLDTKVFLTLDIFMCFVSSEQGLGSDGDIKYLTLSLAWLLRFIQERI